MLRVVFTSNADGLPFQSQTVLLLAADQAPEGRRARRSTRTGGIAVLVNPPCDRDTVVDVGRGPLLRPVHHAGHLGLPNFLVSHPAVDIILGQLDASGDKCNHDGEYNSPTQDFLCHRGAVTFDNEGSVYVADHNLEFDGNLRLLEWDAALLPSNPSSVIYGIPASRVFGRNNDFTQSDCSVSNPMCAPWEPTFNSQGQMVVGFNSYFGTRFPYVYGNPLADSPTANLFDFHSMPFSARFDQNDNLYVLDHNRNRVLIYLQPALEADVDIESIWLPLIFK